MRIYTHEEYPQYSPQWWELRIGVPTASEFSRIITPKKAELSTSASGYINEMLADRQCPTAAFFTERAGHTAAMRNGTDCEPEARQFYAMERGGDVQQVGFCLTDCERFGASPDALVGDDGCLELKVPNRSTHIGYLLNNASLLDTYKCQCHGQLVVTGRKWVDLVSYCPLLDHVIIRVEPGEFTDKLRVALELFWSAYDSACMTILGVPALILREAA